MNKEKVPIKLSTLLIVYLTGFAVILSGVLILFFSYKGQNTETSMLIEFGNTTSKYFALDCTGPLLYGDYGELNKRIREYAALADIESVSVTNSENVVVASSDKVLIGKEYPEKTPGSPAADTGNNLNLVQTVQQNGRLLGYLYFNLSKERVIDSMRKLVRSWIMFSLVIILIMISLASIGVRRVTSFSRDILKVTRKISCGDYTEKARGGGFLESEFVASAINTMERAIEEREKTLARTNSMLESIMNSSPEISIWSVDWDYCYTFFNQTHKQSMKRVWGVDIELGKCILDYVHDKYDIKSYRGYVKKRYDEVLSGKNFNLVEKHFLPDGTPLYTASYSSPIYNEKKEITGLTIFASDITKRKIAEEKTEQSLREKEILLKEIHHRVKNNLQVVSSLLNLQLGRVQCRENREAFTESINRIDSIAMIHERLYSGQDLGRIDMKAYLEDLFDSIQTTFVLKRPVKLVSNMDSVYLNMDQAVPLGLICNEVFTNSFKYAFKKTENPVIEVTMKKEDDGFHTLEIKDNGSGFGKSVDLEKSETLGIVLIKALTSQLAGISTFSGEKEGTVFSFRFPAADST
ncbi:MAG: hypothetical protein DRP59_04935 [Spirochaetes bacterium]|nr:MAG: hypothetical protein DRP59_04935 [Spirochaetota bacterium]